MLTTFSHLPQKKMSSLGRYLQLLKRRHSFLPALLRGAASSPLVSPRLPCGENPYKGLCTVSIAATASSPKAVIFDLGGVVVPSPQRIFDRFEEKHGLEKGSLVATIKATGNGGSFAKMERGEFTVEEFCRPFGQEYLSHTSRELSTEQVEEFVQQLSDFTKLTPNPSVLEMFGNLKSRGIKVAILTNNFRRESGRSVFPEKKLDNVDVVSSLRHGTGSVLLSCRFCCQVVESCVEGVKKPDPAIFDLTLSRLEVEAHEAIFLDDLGSNLKTARLMGMTTIKVSLKHLFLVHSATLAD